MTTPIIVRSGHQLLYSALYAAAWHTGIWLPDQSWELTKDPETWEKVRRDPVVEHAISMRLHNIAAREWQVLPGGEEDDSKRLAELVERALDEIEGLTAAQYQLGQAIMLGRSFGYIAGRRESREVDLGDGVSTNVDLWMPTRIQPVDRRRMRFTPVLENLPNGQTKVKKVDVEIGSFQTGVWRKLEDKDWLNFVKVVFDDDESRLGYGRGILGAIYFYHYAKGVTLREGLRGIERWAQGLKVISVDTDRPGSTGKTNEQLQQDYLEVIEKNMARNTLVIGKEDKFEAMWPSGEGGRMVLDMCHYLDEGVTRLILGSVLPTGGGSGGSGSYARAEVEEDSAERLVVYDRQTLDDAISRDLIGQFLRLNRTQLQRLNLHKAKPPKLRSVNMKRQDPQIAATIATTLLQAGVPLRRDELYSRTGWSAPKPGEEVIEGATPQVGGFPGMGDPNDLGEEPQPDEASPLAEPAPPQEGPRTALLQRRPGKQRRTRVRIF